MMKEEFEKRVNFSVMPKEYVKIEKKYMSGFYGENLDKDEFCKRWLESGGIKEVLQDRINGEIELPPVKRYKSDELFIMMMNNIKKSGEFEKAGKIYDYYLPSEKEPALSGDKVLITDYRFDVRANANFGVSEGIYLDCYLQGKFNDSGKEYLSIGTVKTLKTDIESMKTMSELGGILNYRLTEFVNQNIESFTPDKERINTARKQAEWNLKKLGDNLLITPEMIPLHDKSDGIEIESHTGTWYVIDTMNDYGKNLFLLEHEEYGDEVACIIVDENKNIVLEDVWNGFNDYLESDTHLMRFNPLSIETALEMYDRGYTIHDGYDNPVKSLEEIKKTDPLALKAIDTDVLEFTERNPHNTKNVANKVRLFVDMDGTLARFHDEVSYLERMYEEGFFKNLKPFEDAVNGVRELIKNHKDIEVFVLSAAVDGEPPYCRVEKNAWIDEHLPEIDSEHRIFTVVGEPKAKYIKNGISKDDFLWDDYNVGLEQWEKDGGTSVKCWNNINHKGLVGKLWEGLIVSNANTSKLSLRNNDVCGNLYSIIAKNKTDKYKDITLGGIPDLRWSIVDRGVFGGTEYLMFESVNSDAGRVVTEKDLTLYDCEVGSNYNGLEDYFEDEELQQGDELEI